jgi:hypothetical protein
LRAAFLAGARRLWRDSFEASNRKCGVRERPRSRPVQEGHPGRDPRDLTTSHKVVAAKEQRLARARADLGAFADWCLEQKKAGEAKRLTP